MSPSVKPFNAAKYKALMDGLECAEISISDVLKENNTQRIDSEYFKKTYLKNATILKNDKTFTELKLKVSGGKRLPLGMNFSEYGVPYIRAEDIKSGFIDYYNSPTVNNNLFEILKKYDIKNNNIAITIVGNSIGDVAISKNNDKTCLLTENCAKVIATNEIRAGYLYAFLAGKYGQNQIEREKVGTAQPKLALERIRTFRIRSLSFDFQNKVDSLIQKSWDFLEESRKNYGEAIKEFENSAKIKIDNESSITHKSYIESFVQSGRLDAEYYQPIYDSIEKQICGNNSVLNSCELYDNNFEPDVTKTYQYIELADVDLMARISDVDEIVGGELPTRARRIVKTGQVIIPSIEGSLQSCALITEKFDNALCSTGFFVIDSKKYNAETLLVMFKSPAIQALLKKNCSGTILTGVSKEEFLKIRLPQIGIDAQISIKEKIQQAFKLRQEAESLSNLAVKAVEMAIENDENMALGWLKKTK